MTFASFCGHSSPIERKLNMIKLDDLISFPIAIFMFRFNIYLLPASPFDAFFSKVIEIYHYKFMQSAAKQSYDLPKARTSYIWLI